MSNKVGVHSTTFNNISESASSSARYTHTSMAGPTDCPEIENTTTEFLVSINDGLTSLEEKTIPKYSQRILLCDRAAYRVLRKDLKIISPARALNQKHPCGCSL
jgi:hypothetical protein